MIQGTTTQFKFKLPYSLDELEWVTIKFWQPGNLNLSPITRSKTNCTESDSGQICVSLLAIETARFSDKYKAKVQLRAQPIDGAVFGSKQYDIIVYPMHDDILDDDVPTENMPAADNWVKFDGGTIVNG